MRKNRKKTRTTFLCKSWSSWRNFCLFKIKIESRSLWPYQSNGCWSIFDTLTWIPPRKSFTFFMKQILYNFFFLFFYFSYFFPSFSFRWSEQLVFNKTTLNQRHICWVFICKYRKHDNLLGLEQNPKFKVESHFWRVKKFSQATNKTAGGIFRRYLSSFPHYNHDS